MRERKLEMERKEIVGLENGETSSGKRSVRG